MTLFKGEYDLYYRGDAPPPRRAIHPELGKGNIAFDLALADPLEIHCFEQKIVPLNCWMCPKPTPDAETTETLDLNYYSWGHVLARSSLFSKYGLILVSGVIDPAYSGDGDQLKLNVYRLPKLGVDCTNQLVGMNKPQTAFSMAPIRIAKGEYLAQLVLSPALDVMVNVIPKEDVDLGESRDGFGTTGGYTKESCF